MASLAPVADRPVDGAYRVDISRGRNVGRVSSEWFSRPDDERYLSLTDIYASVRGRAERAKTQVVILAARQRVVARTDEDRESFLRNRGFSKTDTGRVIEMVLAEEGHPPASVYDFVQGITALARGKPHQDSRLELEGKAKKLLEQAR